MDEKTSKRDIISEEKTNQILENLNVLLKKLNSYIKYIDKQIDRKL